MKRLSRLTALLLAIMVLCAAVAYAEGVSIADWTLSDYQNAVDAATENNDSEEDPWGIGGECGTDYCKVITDEFPNMTALEKYAYMMGELYTVDGGEMEGFMLHIAFNHMEVIDSICICGVPLHAPGSSDHEDICPWYEMDVTAEDYYAVYTELSMLHKACYLLGMDEAQLTAIQNLMDDAEKADMPYLLEEGIPDYLRTEAVANWLNENSAVTGEIAALAMEATQTNGIELTQAMGITKDGNLTWLYGCEPMAQITENGYVVDIATGIAVGHYDFETGTFTMGTGSK